MTKEKLTYEGIRAVLLRENAVSLRISVGITSLMAAVLALAFLIGWKNAFRLPHMLWWICPALLLLCGAVLLCASLGERRHLKNREFTVLPASLAAKDEVLRGRRGGVPIRERRFCFGQYGTLPVSDAEWDRFEKDEELYLVLYPWKKPQVRRFYSAKVYEYTA